MCRGRTLPIQSVLRNVERSVSQGLCNGGPHTEGIMPAVCFHGQHKAVQAAARRCCDARARNHA